MGALVEWLAAWHIVNATLALALYLIGLLYCSDMAARHAREIAIFLFCLAFVASSLIAGHDVPSAETDPVHGIAALAGYAVLIASLVRVARMNAGRRRDALRLLKQLERISPSAAQEVETALVSWGIHAGENDDGGGYGQAEAGIAAVREPGVPNLREGAGGEPPPDPFTGEGGLRWAHDAGAGSGGTGSGVSEGVVGRSTYKERCRRSLLHDAGWSAGGVADEHARPVKP